MLFSAGKRNIYIFTAENIVENQMQLVIMKIIIHKQSQSGRFVYLFGVLHKKMISPFSVKSTAEIWFSVFVLQISEKKTKRREQKSQLFTFFPETNTVFA